MKLMHLKALLALVALALVSACNIIPEPSETRVYPLTQSTSLSPVSATYPGSIRVTQPTALQSLDTTRLVVLREDGRQAYWQDIRLQDRLALVLQSSLVQGLNQAQVARHIVTDSDGASYDVALTSAIERFAIVQGDTWQAEVQIRFQLQQGRDRQVIASTSLAATRGLDGRDIGHAFRALSEANADVQQALADWIVSELEQ
ncbi:MAG: membrane integrity-associated transporter subunit PqiC [Idiomarina sp.]|nr:membrane integrity-associated transporter subunit PqiC [Idiomarina sp.]